MEGGGGRGVGDREGVLYLQKMKYRSHIEDQDEDAKTYLFINFETD